MSPVMRNVIVFILLAVLVTGIGFRILASSREQYDPPTVAGRDAQFAQVRGLRIHYEEWGPRRGKPLLLVHGTMAWSRTWRDIAEPLAQVGFRVIAPDLPPFGLSDRPSARVYSRAAQAALISGFADALGLDRFVLAAHSFGAGPAMEAALAQPQRIERVVLISPALQPGHESGGGLAAVALGAGWIRGLAVASTFSNPLAIGFGLKMLVHDPAVITAERTDLYTLPLYLGGTTDAVGDWLMTGLLGDQSQSRAADPASYAGFTQSVLLIWGDQDTVTPVANAQLLLDTFPNARLETLEGIGHIPQIERPKAVADLTARFMGARGIQPKPAAPLPATATPAAPAAEAPAATSGALPPLVSAAGLRGSVTSSETGGSD